MDGQGYGIQQVKRVLTANNVALYSTENEEKSSVVERWNRTMKNIMWKYFTANNTQKYIDVLPRMVVEYNNTSHRSIKLKPTDARKPANYKHIHKARIVNARKAQQTSNVFASQEALHAANVSPLTSIETFSGARSGKIKADFYNGCQDIPDPSTLDPMQKNLLPLDDCFLGKQSKAEA